MNSDMIFCEMIRENIEVGDCVANRDVAGGFYKEECLERKFEENKVENWREVCMKCKYHEE